MQNPTKKRKVLLGRLNFSAAVFILYFLYGLIMIQFFAHFIIASGKLSILKFFETIPWLLIYNLIFITPMIIVTLIIYFGISTVDKVSGWKEKNIRNLHLIEGIILSLLGIAMFTGLI